MRWIGFTTSPSADNLGSRFQTVQPRVLLLCELLGAGKKGVEMADDHSEVMAAIGRVHDQVGTLGEKVEKIGTATGVLQIDVAVMAEKLRNNVASTSEAKKEARKAGAAVSAGIATIITAIGAAVAKLTGGH